MRCKVWKWVIPITIGLLLLGLIQMSSPSAAPKRMSLPSEEDLLTIEEKYPQYLENILNNEPFVGDAKTNIGLVNFAHKALNEKWGYVYGGKGQYMTKEILDQIIGIGFDVYRGRNGYQYRQKTRLWEGQRAADCSGLIVSYFWWAGDNMDPVRELSPDLAHYYTENMLEIASEKGSMHTLPEIPGLLLHRYGHVGIYIGNGEVIEAKGVGYGVVKTKIEDSYWSTWAKFPYIDYETNGHYVLGDQLVYIRDGAIVTTSGVAGPPFAGTRSAQIAGIPGIPGINIGIT